MALTRYCYYQYCMVYSMQTGGWKGSRILSNNRVIVLYQDGQCRWARGVNGWWIRAQQPQSKRISCKGQGTSRCARVGLTRCIYMCVCVYIHIYLYRVDPKLRLLAAAGVFNTSAPVCVSVLAAASKRSFKGALQLLMNRYG